jgi:small subunit ribosomal protein S17
MSGKKSKRKIRMGVVVSDKMRKTIIVRVMRLAKHSRYKRIIRKYSKFYVHDENNQAKVGNIVKIEEVRPISKSKRWRLTQILR